MGWFFAWLGFGFMGLSILVVPQDAFAYSGECSACKYSGSQWECAVTCCTDNCGSGSCADACCKDGCAYPDKEGYDPDCYDNCQAKLKRCDSDSVCRTNLCIDPPCVNGSNYCNQTTNPANCKDCSCIADLFMDCVCRAK